MKTSKLLLTAFTISLQSVIVNHQALMVNAQPITITQNDMAIPGTMIIIEQFTNFNFTDDPGGVNKTWDFSYLTGGNIDTAYYINPNEATSGSDFPGSNLAHRAGNIAFFYDYYNLNSNVFERIGNEHDGPGNNSDYTFHLNPPQKVHIFPCTYGTTFSGSTKWEPPIPADGPGICDSIMRKVSYNYSSTIAGWGTIITALGNFSCLYEKYDLIETDSTFCKNSGIWSFKSVGTDDATYYNWWVNGFPDPIFQVSFALWNDTFAYVLKEVHVGYDEKSVPEMKLSQKNEKIIVDYIPHGAEKLLVYDISGKLLSEYKIKGKTATVNLQQKNQGIYFITIAGAGGKILTKQIFNYGSTEK